MDYGLSCYQIGDGPLAQRLNARWAHCFADLTEGVPDHRELHADMAEHGCLPIPDLRTSVAALGAMVANGEGEIIDRRDAAIGAYADSILRYLDMHETVTRVEVWGSAEVAQFMHGRGELIDYCSILKIVYGRIKEMRPHVAIWTGGFGCGHGLTADLSMLEWALKEHAPNAFDACNMHPFILSIGGLEYDVNTLRLRLQKARETLDRACAGQPLVSTGFGIPTVDMPAPPPQYGRFWKPFGVRVIPEAEAAAWWIDLTAVLEEVGVQVVCVLARDVVPAYRFHHLCGLTRANGSDKAFTAEVCETIRGR